MLKLNSVPGNSSEIQGWSTWCWKDSQKVQGPVTCEKVQSGEEAIMLLISCKAIFLPRKSKLSVTEMLEEMKPYIWDEIGCNKVWKWCMFKNKELLMREKIFVGRFTRAQERKIFWPAFYFSIRYSHTHFTQATNCQLAAGQPDTINPTYYSDQMSWRAQVSRNYNVLKRAQGWSSDIRH